MVRDGPRVLDGVRGLDRGGRMQFWRFQVHLSGTMAILVLIDLYKTGAAHHSFHTH